MENRTELRQPIDSAFPFTQAEVVFAAREEMARTVEDVLSRRTRALLLDARAAQRAAASVATVLAEELGRDEAWIQLQLTSFNALARTFYELNGAPQAG